MFVRVGLRPRSVGAEERVEQFFAVQLKTSRNIDSSWPPGMGSEDVAFALPSPQQERHREGRKKELSAIILSLNDGKNSLGLGSRGSRDPSVCEGLDWGALVQDGAGRGCFGAHPSQVPYIMGFCTLHWDTQSSQGLERLPLFMGLKS